jgi:integrase
MAWIKGKTRLNKETGRKDTYYVIEWRDETGKSRTKGLGFCGKQEAHRLLKLFEGKVAAGQPVEPEPPPSAPSSPEPVTIPTLREYLFERYLPVVQRDRARKTYETAQCSAKALSARLGEHKLDELGYALVDDYVTERKQQGRRSRTIILELLCLKRALDHAVKSGVLERVPELPELRDRDRKPHRFLTAEESVRLLDALHPDRAQPHAVTRGKPPESRDPLCYLAVLMALNTGMRKGEILSRTWSDVRWTMGPHGTLLVGARQETDFRTKTRKERTIPLTPDLREALLAEFERAGRPPAGWIFPSPTDPSQPRDNFAKSLRYACRRAGIPQIHPHGLRHTWASRLAMAGVDRKTLMELGGWTSGVMLDAIYAHVTSQHVAEVMAKMGIAGSASPGPQSGLRDSTAGQDNSATRTPLGHPTSNIRVKPGFDAMEANGLEPMTPCLQSRCSPN